MTAWWSSVEFKVRFVRTPAFDWVLTSLWQVDRALFRAIHEGWRSAGLDAVMVAITTTGLGHVQGLVLLVVGLFAKAARPTVWACFWAAAVAGIVRLGIMRWADRMRPSNFAFADPFESVFGNSSFPSGHTTTSFAIAVTLVYLSRGSRPWIGWIAIAWACLVGLSRVYVGVHYPTDVLGAAALGLACASALELARRRRAA